MRMKHFFRKVKNIVVTGFSSFFVDVAMGIVTALLNNQIMKYTGADADRQSPQAAKGCCHTDLLRSGEVCGLRMADAFRY
nr:hypothetical protein [Clostridium sp.]